MTAVACATLAITLWWCHPFQCGQVVQRLHAPIIAHAFEVHRSWLPIKKSSGVVKTLGSTGRATYNALTYQSVDLEPFVRNQSRVKHQQRQHNATAIAPSTVTSSTTATTQRKYGVTSLHVIPFRTVNRNDVDVSPHVCHVLVGTKYGELVSLPLELRKTTWVVSRSASAEWPSQNLTATRQSPSPNYCISSIKGKTKTMLLIGSADRYVHVWQTYHPSTWVATDRSRWRRTQQLGPHTGWVKSMVVLPSVSHHKSLEYPIDTDRVRHRFLSIGCNRIERWISSICENDIEDAIWTHVGTTSISSSPTISALPKSNPATGSGAVCTLSSDLLCLEICNIITTSNETYTIIAVGGVDGRIHFYNDSKTVTDSFLHVGTITAHQGRVNALSYDTKQNCLMSGSHDGTLRCWSFDWNTIAHNQIFLDGPIATYRFSDGKRITALVCFRPQSNRLQLNVIAGTQNGSIHLLTLIRSSDSEEGGIVSITDIRIDNNNGEANTNGPTINTICRLPATTNSNVPLDAFVVGHSQGMGIVQRQGEVASYLSIQ